jgi:hypothetical protein
VQAVVVGRLGSDSLQSTIRLPDPSASGGISKSQFDGEPDVHPSSGILDFQVGSPGWELTLESPKRARGPTYGRPKVLTNRTADRNEARDHSIGELL